MTDKINVDIIPKDGKVVITSEMVDAIKAAFPNAHFEFLVLPDKINVDILPKDGKFSTAKEMINEIKAACPNDHFEFFVKDIYRKSDTVSIGDNSSYNNVQIHSNFQKSESDNHD